jgi:hypothetical protein
MSKYLILFLIICLLTACADTDDKPSSDIIARGQMPSLVKDKHNTMQLVYGNGDSIMYSYTTDAGQIFSKPTLISILPELAASHTRGPQIASTSNGLVVTACNASGNIYSYVKTTSGAWQQTGKVNDRDTTAKENLMALGADGNLAFAVWLDLRDNKHNKIYGSQSTDGGKTWSNNILVYASPDTTVCECCKPSVQVKGKNVYVMFRNWLNGNRDMYVVQSNDGGESFAEAQKLGTGSWKLDGCPMDGGGLAVNEKGEVQTVWRREATIYASTVGTPEAEIGQGKGCTLESVNGKNVYAWTENGNVTVLTPQGQKKMIGNGSAPQLKALNSGNVICVWEHEKQIHARVVKL